MKPFITLAIAFKLVGSLLCAPTAIAIDTISQYKQAMAAALEFDRGTRAVAAASGVFRRAANGRLGRNAPRLIKIANSQLASRIRPNHQRGRATSFLNTVNSTTVFRRLTQNRLNKAVQNALQGIPRGLQSRQALPGVRSQLLATFRRNQDLRTPQQFNQIINDAARTLDQPAPPPIDQF